LCSLASSSSPTHGPAHCAPHTHSHLSYFLRNWPNLCFLAFDRAVPPPPGAAAPRALPLRLAQEEAPGGGGEGGPGEGACIGVVVAKQGPHGAAGTSRGYIAMLVVAVAYRGRRIGADLASQAVAAAAAAGAAEAVLEADASNGAALALYAGLGFLRDKRLARYYLSGADAYRLKLLLPERGVDVGEGGDGGSGGEDDGVDALAGLAVSGTC